MKTFTKGHFGIGGIRITAGEDGGVVVGVLVGGLDE